VSSPWMWVENELDGMRKKAVMV